MRSIEEKRICRMKYYYKNKGKELQTNKTRRAKVREFIKKVKSVPCADCNRRFPYYCMDFDHVRGIKLFNVGSLGNSTHTKKIEVEIKKCEVVCATCHRKREYERGHIY